MRAAHGARQTGGVQALTYLDLLKSSMAQFPAQITKTTKKLSGSPLAGMLCGLLEERHGKSLNYDQVSPIMHGILAMAALHPFDPKEKVSWVSGYHNNAIVETTPLIEAVLRLACANQEPPTQSWPQEIGGFGPQLETIDRNGEPNEIGTEWVAAALVAVGCNPWEDKTQGLPEAVRLALNMGMGGLVERFLECDGAMKPQQLLDLVIDDQELMTSTIVNPKNAWIVERLVERGAKISSEEHVLSVLSTGKPNIVEILGKAGLPKTTESTKKKIRSAWTARVKQNDLSAQQVGDMLAQTFGSEGDEMTAAALDIQRFLGVEWGKPPNSSTAQAYGFTIKDANETSASERAVVRAGAMGGEWSVFAAAVASRIRIATGGGAAGWSTHRMLRQSFNEQTKTWELADVSQAPFKGCLKSAMGFDWKPGILIDGVVALGLLGQCGENLSQSMFASRRNQDKIDEEVEKDIERFGLAAGIEDPRAWAEAHAQDAAAFTCRVLKANHSNQTKALLSTWGVALGRCPGMARAIDDQTKTDLLAALCGNFQMTTYWHNKPSDAEKDRFTTIARTLWPDLQGAAMAGGLAPGPKREAALILDLVSEKLNPTLLGEKYGGLANHMTIRELDLLANHASSYSLEEDRIQGKALVNRWKLEAVAAKSLAGETAGRKSAKSKM